MNAEESFRGERPRSKETALPDPLKASATEFLAAHAFDIARSLGAVRVLVQADELSDIRLVERLRKTEGLIWVTRESALPPGADAGRDVVIPIPDGSLNRLSRVHLAFLLAVLNGLIDREETILCLSGIVGSGRLDTLFLTNPLRDLPWLKRLDPDSVATNHLGRTLTVALRLASEGREGKPIGTIFVLGDLARLAPYLRQLILNPCAGHPEHARSIQNPEFFESVREFAAMDGAFVINERGIVEAAGVYLNAALQDQPLRAGFGARHAAALAVTVGTGAVAVVISSSSGAISVFQEGRLILELEKP